MELIKQVVKKYFLSFRLSKKQLIFDLLLLLILGLVFPLYPAHAIFGIFGGVADAIGKAIGGVIAGFLTAIPAAIFGIAALILQWTLDPAFIRVPSYTSGAIVDIGWPIVRDLANMMIVLVLVVIGLTTALRLEEYPTRKLLPRLVFVALLINFTPVIMGVIVDACNIVMYFFLDGLMGVEATTRVFAAIHSVVVSDLSNFNFFNPLQQWLFMQKITIIWIFYLLASIIYLLFAFLFIIRRIAIWMLVIFSPIAFVAYILPFTRGLFRTWWHQFIQWSIIGVFAAFFLYLGDHIIGLAGTGAFVGSAPGGFGGWVVRPVITMLEQMMPFIIALIFLLFGFFVALSTSAMGASGIIAGAQRATKAAPALAGKYAVAQTAGRFLATEKGKQWMKRLGEAKLVPSFREVKEARGLKKAAVVAGIAAAPIGLPMQWAVRYGAKTGLEYGARQPQEVGKRVKEYEEKFGKDIERAAATYPSIAPTDWQGKVAMALYLSKTKGAKGLAQLRPEQLQDMVKLAARYHPARLEDIVKHKPELIEHPEVGELVQGTMVRRGWEDEDVRELTKIGVAPVDAIRKAAFKKAVDALKGEDVEALTRTTIENPEFQEAVARFKSWSFIRRLGDEKGLSYLETLQRTAQKIGAEDLAKTNPTFLRAPYTPAGSMFLHEWDEGDKREIEKIIRRAPETLRPDTEVEKIIRSEKEGEEEEKRRRPPRERPPEERGRWVGRRYR